jgi:hypothetical protein
MGRDGRRLGERDFTSMDILKYLDVLIGLAVVMILLSPLVSAITQLWIWLWNMRASRLQVALQGLIRQLNGNPYERFEAVAISGLPPGTAVTLQGVTATANAAGVIVFQNNIPQLLQARTGTLTFAPPLGQLGPTAVATLRARGPVGDWEIRSPNTDGNGRATVTYAFPGPAQFASIRAAVTTLPAGASLSAKIVSGAARVEHVHRRSGDIMFLLDLLRLGHAAAILARLVGHLDAPQPRRTVLV